MHELRGETTTEVVRACVRAGARAERLEADEHPGRASLLVATLHAGARRIPDEVLDLARRVPVPVLLLCDEELARPTTTLQAGRVTLLERDSAPDRLYSRIRMLLAPRRPEAGRRERKHPLFWTGDFGDACTVLAEHPDGVAQEEGLTSIVPLDDEVDPKVALRDAAGILRHTRRSADQKRELTALLGSTAGVIHVSPEARDWIFYWPAERGALWFFSLGRLPQLSELSPPDGAPRFFRFSASSGDLAVGASKPIARTPEGTTTLANGGPAVLDHLTELSGPSAPTSGLVVEVR